MPKLIDADDLLMDNSWAFYDENGNRNDACIAVENAPTVDAEPVRHGHWEWDGDYICSNCGERGHRNKWKYCPNCGAKMDEEIKDAKTN